MSHHHWHREWLVDVPASQHPELPALTWTLLRLIIGRQEIRMEATVQFLWIGIRWAQGWRDWGIYLWPLNVEFEHDKFWADEESRTLRLFRPPAAPRCSCRDE